MEINYCAGRGSSLEWCKNRIPLLLASALVSVNQMIPSIELRFSSPLYKKGSLRSVQNVLRNISKSPDELGVKTTIRLRVSMAIFPPCKSNMSSISELSYNVFKLPVRPPSSATLKDGTAKPVIAKYNRSSHHPPDTQVTVTFVPLNICGPVINVTRNPLPPDKLCEDENYFIVPRSRDMTNSEKTRSRINGVVGHLLLLMICYLAIVW